VLGEAVEADRDFPPTDRSAMDGFAVRSADAAGPGCELRVIGEVRAGQQADRALEPQTALRIFTGAVVPSGADAVVMVEQTHEVAGSGRVRIERVVESGQHIRRQGQDIERGTRVLEPGVTIRAAEIAALASVGHSRVRVHRRPVVHVLSTGDELVEVGQTPLAHQVRNSNAPMLISCLGQHGIAGELLGNAPDRPVELEHALSRGLSGDLLLITGGVSVGQYDLVREALIKSGMQPLFHGVAMKPGKPILAGRRGRCAVVGLPGNPLSAFVGFVVLVAPALRKLIGRSRIENFALSATLAAPLRSKPGRVTYHLCVARSVDGELRVTPTSSTGSGDVLALARANAFVVAGAQGGDYPNGSRVAVMLWKDCCSD
jgi:molybdopterin molybdotransferase